MKIRALGIFLIVLNLFGCSHYIDSKVTGRQTPSNSGLISYDSYNLFLYDSDVTHSKDREITKPVHFEVHLPKKLKYFVGHNGSDFGFYYDGNQVIFIKTDFNKPDGRTMYEPSKEELDHLIQFALVTSNDKFDIKEIAASPSNKNMIIIRELVNIAVQH
jgi:hypothetical protein